MSFSNPLENVLQLGVREGMKVADLGTGSGHYALALAEIVGATGRVYAVDIQEDILTRLKGAATERGLRNIDTVWSDFEKQGGTRLKSQAIDAVVLSNTLFQLSEKAGAVAEIKRILKPLGKLLVIDWAGAYGGMGPLAHHVVPEHEAEQLFIAAGFHKLKDFRAGGQHYSIVFAAPEA